MNAVDVGPERSSERHGVRQARRRGLERARDRGFIDVRRHGTPFLV